MRPTLIAGPRLAPGDRVAVVSPSAPAAGRFPHVHETAMHRLREEIGVVPVEYPSTRQLDASPAERARDLMAAFADPGIRAVLATIGGEDQITVLPHLDPAVFVADPKPFFGYSDNTNLLNWLWNLGIAGAHGGSTMVHLGRAGGLDPVSAGSLRTALFGGELTVLPVAEFSEDEADWESASGPDVPTPTRPGPGWTWHHADRVVTSPTWGGNLEILHWNLAAGRWIRPVEDYAGCILLLETSEEMPAADDVFRMLRNVGERGLLEQFPAALIGLAKASSLERRTTDVERHTYRRDQRAAVLRAFERYNPDALLVFDIDFGHTDPQYVLPYGGELTIDGPERTITARW